MYRGGGADSVEVSSISECDARNGCRTASVDPGVDLGSAVGFEAVASSLRLYSATSVMVLFVFVLATAFCSVAAYLLMAQRLRWSRKAPKHCTLNVDSMMTVSKLNLTLDLSNANGCSSTSSSSSQDTPHESPSSNGSASEEPVGEKSALWSESGVLKSSCCASRRLDSSDPSAHGGRSHPSDAATVPRCSGWIDQAER